jgi:parallel beta-helix repeat protein
MRYLIWLMMLFVLLGTAAGLDCSLPSELIGDIDGNVTICPGVYPLLNPISLKGALECEGAILNGTADTTGIIITGNGTIRDCVLEGFKIGVMLRDASGAKVISSSFINNEIGLYILGGSENTIRESIFKDNAGAILLNSTLLNMIYNNTFYPTGLLNLTDNLNIYCLNGTGNEYVDESGPVCPKAVPIPEANLSNLTSFNSTNHTSKIPIEEVIKIGSPAGSRVQDVMLEILAIEGHAGSLENALSERMKEITETMEIVSVNKTLVIDRKAKRTTVKTLITVKRNVTDLYVYEFIPKCIAATIDEINFATKPERILKRDPIVVWHFPLAGDGDIIELSYDVNKEIEMPPETIVITEEINVTGEGSCETPFSIPLKKGKEQGSRFILPLLFIPIIAAGYLYLNRFKKHFRRK